MTPFLLEEKHILFMKFLKRFIYKQIILQVTGGTPQHKRVDSVLIQRETLTVDTDQRLDTIAEDTIAEDTIAEYTIAEDITNTSVPYLPYLRKRIKFIEDQITTIKNLALDSPVREAHLDRMYTYLDSYYEEYNDKAVKEPLMVKTHQVLDTTPEDITSAFTPGTLLELKKEIKSVEDEITVTKDLKLGDLVKAVKLDRLPSSLAYYYGQYYNH
jgi:hypothetical protein